MSIGKEVIVAQIPINDKGEVEYDGLDGQRGIITHELHGSSRFTVKINPTEEKPIGTLVNFRVVDLKIEESPVYTK